MPQVSVDYRTSSAEIDKLLSLHRGTFLLAAGHRKLIAEIALLRLFDILQNTFKSISCKLLCGANYVDGTRPVVIAASGSMRGAAQMMESFSRQKHRTLNWSKTAEIKENLRFVLDPRDHLVRVLDQNGAIIDEIRRVRNRIAHNNATSRSNYRLVVQRHYGAYLNSLTPGSLLLSPRQTPALMEQYLIRSRILIKGLVKA
jgi:hypothetical protein